MLGVLSTYNIKTSIKEQVNIIIGTEEILYSTRINMLIICKMTKETYYRNSLH